MEKWCLHASSFYQIIIKVAGYQDRHKSLVEFDFGPNQTTHFGVTCPWVTKISHFWTWITLEPVCQSWSNFVCSSMGWGKGCIRFWGRLDHSGERSLPFGLLVSSFFFLSNYQTLKNFVTFFSGTVKSRRLKLGTQVDSEQMYRVYRNQATAAYSSLYFFIFLSLQFSNIKIFRHTSITNCEA